MKEHSRIINLVNSKFYPLLLFVVSFVFVTLFSRSTSFLYVFEGGDPSVFKQMGMALIKGKILYVDYFDNKGCILYFIHALGLWLGGDFFILLMQAISLTITLVIWDKMLALYRDEKHRIIGLAIALVLLLCFYAAGDQSQEWCLPFASYPLLIYYRSRQENREICPKQFFLIGICASVITFIIVNNTIVILGFLVYLWFEYLWKKDFKRLFSSLLWLSLGFLIITCSILVYFYLKAGWYGVNEMMYASFFSNFEYLDYKSSRSISYILPYCLFIVAFSFLSIINMYKEKDIIIPTIIALVLFILTNGTLCNTYYLLALLPLCIVLLMTYDQKKHRKINTCLCLIALCGFYINFCNPVYLIVNDAILGKENERMVYEDFHHCFEQIPIQERDSVYNYNLIYFGTGLMQHEGYIQCNKVLFTSLTFILPKLWKEETSKLVVNPKWIMISFDKQYLNDDADFIKENYELFCSTHYVYFRNPKYNDEFDVHLYRRKD